MMKTLPDMGSSIYSQLQGKQKISFHISFLFFAMFTDGLVFDVILILAVTHQTHFVGFFFLVHTDGSLLKGMWAFGVLIDRVH